MTLGGSQVLPSDACGRGPEQFSFENTPFMLWQRSRSPLRIFSMNSGKLLSAGPEKTKSIHSRFLTNSWPIGASQLAPPITITALGLAAFNLLAIAIEETVWVNIEVKPTISD